MTDPRTPAEALRWAAWTLFDHANNARAAAQSRLLNLYDLEQAVGREKGCLVAARFMHAEAARLDALPVEALSEADVEASIDAAQRKDGFNGTYTDVGDLIAELAKRGLAIVRVP